MISEFIKVILSKISNVSEEKELTKLEYKEFMDAFMLSIIVELSIIYPSRALIVDNIKSKHNIKA